MDLHVAAQREQEDAKMSPNRVGRRFDEEQGDDASPTSTVRSDVNGGARNRHMGL